MSMAQFRGPREDTRLLPNTSFGIVTPRLGANGCWGIGLGNDADGQRLRASGYPSNLPAIPIGWEARPADNSRGVMYQRPGATGNADSIRIMQPTRSYPNGYLRCYNSSGQPLDVNGIPGPLATTHIPLDYPGPWPGWPT